MPYKNFKKLSFKSKNTRGRKYKKENDDDESYYNKISPFCLDIIKIKQSKSLRRLMDKTQVFSEPLNPHTRTRRSHTDEVFAISTIISESFKLNTLLCQAIALAHDIGHTPYGHMGEKFISQKSTKNFRHEKFGIIILQEIERKGKGLNLSYETLRGILNHSRGDGELTVSSEIGLPLEYDVVMYADKIAYTTGDFSDYKNRINKIEKNNIPDFINFFGNNQREMINKCISSLVNESMEKNIIIWKENNEAIKFNQFKKWMYKNVYYPNNTELHYATLESVYEIVKTNYKNCDPNILLAIMTDKEVYYIASQILHGKKNFINYNGLGFIEIIPFIENKIFDFENPDLNW